jgi:Uma2 family endonuclease
MNTVSVNIPDKFKVSSKQFELLAIANPDLRLEKNANGELIVMPPTGGDTSRKNAEITIQLGLWNRQCQKGIVFDSSGGFILPNGAERSPDASWVEKSRWDKLTKEQQTTFPPLTPDFVIELLSPSDTLKNLQDKMKEYIDNGTKLGWLIDPKTQKVEIYCGDRIVEILESPGTLSGEDVLEGFILDLSTIWS